MKTAIYLDYNATAPMRDAVRDGIAPLLGLPLNASSVHSYGREARLMVERARDQVAALVGAPPAQVIFNSGATEGNNTVIRHFAPERILVSATEHPSVLEAAQNLTHIPVTQDGLIDLDAFEALLKAEATALVSVMLVNNETGVIQPIKDISALAKRHGALVHCDAVQAAGRIPIDITDLGIDFLTLSAHKLGGPQGVGALVLGLCGQTPTLLFGGGQEKSARAGTENIAAIVGFGLAAGTALCDMQPSQDRLAALRDELEESLCAKMPDIIIHGRAAPRVANTCLLSVPGIPSQTMLMAMDLEGIALSNGAACSSGTVQVSHVLRAMGCDDDLAGSALRVSMGWGTQKSDLEKFLLAFEAFYNRKKRASLQGT